MSTQERDCNTCAFHKQGEHPTVTCRKCIGSFEVDGTYLPYWFPRRPPMSFPKIELVPIRETIELTDVSPHAVVTDYTPRKSRDVLIEDPVKTKATDTGAMRGFSTGATRTNDAGRIDPEAFISPAVLLRYCEYMNRNRTQADGNVRAGDNWQKGIPVEAYRKSIQRHNLELWSLTRDQFYVHPEGKTVEDVLCALLFNHMGMLHELLKEKNAW
jgi:hypothetical protein